MIDISNYQLELQTKEVVEGNSFIISNLSTLLFDFKKFRKEVDELRSNFQGPDYFDIFESLLELQFLLDRTIHELQTHVVNSNRIAYRPLEASLQLSPNRKKEAFRNDIDRIASVVSGLDKLIQSNRKAVKESKVMSNFFVESLLVDFEKELEKSRWIFYMFSKY